MPYFIQSAIPARVRPKVPTYREGGKEKVFPWRVPIRFFRLFQSHSELPAILSSSQLPFHMDSLCSAATPLRGLTLTCFFKLSLL